MQLISKRVPIDFNLFLFSCTHFGSVLCHYNGFKQLIDMMHSKYADLPESHNFGIHHGDIIEAIRVDDRRFDPLTNTEPFPLRQAEFAVKQLTPIKDKLIVVLRGNHERKLKLFGDLAEDIAKNLNVPYGTEACKVSYLDRRGRLMFKHYMAHGSKPIASYADSVRRQQANMELILERHLKKKAGDCVLMSKAHVHRL